MADEQPILTAALLTYAIAALVSAIDARRGKSGQGMALVIMILALALHTVAIALRWQRLGHAPYADMFEILSSNVWSLHVAVLLACLALPYLRPALVTALPILQLLVVWLFVTDPADPPAPVTYDTIWLPVHITFGKLFLGCLILAVMLGAVVAVRRVDGRAFRTMPNCRTLDDVAYQFVLLAFLFESLMLVAGGLWAQDARGRYWVWDPLETWTFLTWLAAAACLHVRALKRPSPQVSALLVFGVFVIAFLTFFGVPFLSTAPHKGAI
ncbi:MAG: cytochrome c biogenesis protein CcsA [Alphaproteobacteria bacterium]